MDRKNFLFYTITFFSIGIPFIIFQLTSLFSGYQQVGYTGHTIFTTKNFLALIYGIYRILFRVPYELFFNDFMKEIPVIRIVSYVISLIVNAGIFMGFYITLKNKNDFGYFFNVLFLSFLVLFLIHSPPEKDLHIFIMLAFYDARYFILVYPIICYYLVKSIEKSQSPVYFLFGNTFQSVLQNILKILVIGVIFFNIYLVIKSNIRYKNTKKLLKTSLNFGINHYKVLCVIDKENESDDHLVKAKKWKKNYISYILFRKVCEYNYNTNEVQKYDYVIDFTGKIFLPNFKEIYGTYAWQNNFRVLKKLQ